MTKFNLDMFTPEERALVATLDPAKLPQHVAIIMDGNGRWAAQQHLPRVVGHRAGVETVRRMVRACGSLNISYLTVYSFSSENWGRPGDEVHALMDLHEASLREEMAALHAEGVRVRHIGRLDELPSSLRGALTDAMHETRDNTRLTFTLALNYGGRRELVDAVRALAARAAAGDLDPATLTEADIAGALYAPDLPDPDLLIRTAGEMRISNFLLWQIAYTEYWSTATLWPDFTPAHLLEALQAYQGRQRKFGKVVS